MTASGKPQKKRGRPSSSKNDEAKAVKSPKKKILLTKGSPKTTIKSEKKQTPKTPRTVTKKPVKKTSTPVNKQNKKECKG